MDTFMNAVFKNRCRRSQTEDEGHGSMYESAFTYNTEQEFANTYHSVDLDYNSVKNPDEREHLADILKNDGAQLSFSVVIELLCFTLSFILLIFTLPFSLFFCLKFIPSFERLVVFRMGKILKVSGPGTIVVLPCIDKAIKIDIRNKPIQIPALQVISADKGIVEMEVVAFVRVNDAIAAVCTLSEHEKIIRNIAYTSLYNHLVRLMISDLTNVRTQGKIMAKVKETLNEFIKGSGVEVTDLNIVKVTTVKPGENQQLLSSDVGKELMGTLGTHAAEFLASGGHVSSEKSSQSSFTSAFSSMMTPPTPSSSGSTIPISSPTPNQENIPSNATLDSLIEKIRQCCDANLVARIGKFYRILCELDGHIYTIDLNLRCGEGYCGLSPPNVNYQPPCDVTFSLNYSTLISLIRGEVSPVSVYLNGNVKISGSVEDAMSLNHLSTRAKELNLKLI